VCVCVCVPWPQVHAYVIKPPAPDRTRTTYGCNAADFRNAAEYWLFPYESPTFRYELEGVWEQVRPLYELMHAYVRRKLRDLYGPDKLSRKAPLPAHVLGMSQILLQYTATGFLTPDVSSSTCLEPSARSIPLTVAGHTQTETICPLARETA